MINWTQGDGWDTFGGPDGNLAPWWTNGIQSTYGGWFHVYAFTMTLGMILAVAFSAYKFWKKDISLSQLALGVIIIVPMSLFGGSIFGKLNADGPGQNANGVGFWGLWAFWHAGMAIHGGVYVGAATGLIVFGLMGMKTKVSLWTYMDAIIPNILLGQAIGRWGNFFNHEVVGAPVGDVGTYVNGVFTPNGHSFLTSLPNYIRTNTQFLYNGHSEVVNGIDMIPGHVYQMAPIFLYEVIGLMIAWGIITFVIPNIGKWIGPKPWKRHKDNFEFSWGQTFLNIVAPWKFMSNNKTEELTQNAYLNDDNFSNVLYKNKSWWMIWKQAYTYNPNYNQRDEYHKKISIIKSEYKNKTAMRYQYGKALAKANNPDGYWTTKVGCEASAYFLFWNVVRFALEVQRPEDHLFIMYEKGLSLALIGVTGLIGLLGMILTQNVSVWFFRQPGYQYEKQFFVDQKIDKEWWNPFKTKDSLEKRELKSGNEILENKSSGVYKTISKNDDVFSNKKTSAELKAQAKLEKMKNKQRSKK